MLAARPRQLKMSGTMMNFAKLAISVLLASATGLVSFSTAKASGCQNPNVVQIKIPRGAYCWVYQGKGTHFRGRFGRGQQLQVQMSGPGDSWSPRDISVSAPNGPILPGYGRPGSFETTLPVSGTYEIGYGPCYQWHGFGRVVICAR